MQPHSNARKPLLVLVYNATMHNSDSPDAILSALVSVRATDQTSPQHINATNLAVDLGVAKMCCARQFGQNLNSDIFLREFIIKAKEAGYKPVEVIGAHFAVEKPQYIIDSARSIGYVMSSPPAVAWPDMTAFLLKEYEIKVNSTLPSQTHADKKIGQREKHCATLGISKFASEEQIKARIILLVKNFDANIENAQSDASVALLRSKKQEAIDSCRWLLENKDGVFPAMDRLNGMVGLDGAKKEIHRLVCLMQAQQMRKAAGMPVSQPSLHLVFIGNPGTGKTTIARLIGQVYASLGLLSSGHVIEADRASLVAEYVGQTAIKTREKIKEAIGGVLFIDEAYSLSSGNQNDFGQEAVTTLIKEMEDRRDAFAVIVAGYTEEMKRFMASNPGLMSRFSRHIEFADYTAAELQEIFLRLCTAEGLSLSAEAGNKLLTITTKMVAEKSHGFGNARAVRALYENTLENQAIRIVEGGANKIDLIEADDIPL